MQEDFRVHSNLTLDGKVLIGDNHVILKFRKKGTRKLIGIGFPEEIETKKTNCFVYMNLKFFKEAVVCLVNEETLRIPYLH